MITLAFDTCLDKMYAVLKRDNEILASKIIATFQVSFGKYRPSGL